MDFDRLLDGDTIADMASEIADNAELLAALNDYTDEALIENEAEWVEYRAMTRAYTDED